MRIVFRDLPLNIHADAQLAAEAALCAKDQGKFWEYHDKLFENQRALGRDQLKQHAVEVGLKAESFNACLDGGKYTSEVLQDAADAAQLGVTGTPAFFVNGRQLSGAQPFEAFQALIDEELARLGKGGGATK